MGSWQADKDSLRTTCPKELLSEHGISDQEKELTDLKTQKHDN